MQGLDRDSEIKTNCTYISIPHLLANASFTSHSKYIYIYKNGFLSLANSVKSANLNTLSTHNLHDNTIQTRCI